MGNKCTILLLTGPISRKQVATGSALLRASALVVSLSLQVPTQTWRVQSG